MLWRQTKWQQTPKKSHTDFGVCTLQLSSGYIWISEYEAQKVILIKFYGKLHSFLLLNVFFPFSVAHVHIESYRLLYFMMQQHLPVQH